MNRSPADGPALPRDYAGVAVAAPVSFGYARWSRREVHWFLGQALAAMLAEAGLEKREVDGLAVASYGLAPDHAAALAEHLGLSLRWCLDLAVGGAAGVVALQRAARAVQAGDAEVVACLAADTLGGGRFRELVAGFSGFARDAVYPYGAGGPNAVFALITDHYMRATGARREDFGAICLAQRENGRANPMALLRRPLTMAAYLAARPIAPPLGLYDCVLPCCGAEGFLVLTAARARRLGLATAGIGGLIERHNGFPEEPVQRRGGWAADRDSLYAQAGLEPAAVDFLQAYDDYPVVVMMQLEELGFCPPDGAPDYVRRHDLRVGGDLPVNTGGGQLACGQAGAAGGFLGVTEGLRQLLRRPLGAQVVDAEIGLVSGYGTVTYDRGLCSAAALLRRQAA